MEQAETMTLGKQAHALGLQERGDTLARQVLAVVELAQPLSLAWGEERAAQAQPIAVAPLGVGRQLDQQSTRCIVRQG